jgi:hypothetical protein
MTTELFIFQYSHLETLFIITVFLDIPERDQSMCCLHSLLRIGQIVELCLPYFFFEEKSEQYTQCTEHIDRYDGRIQCI